MRTPLMRLTVASAALLACGADETTGPDRSAIASVTALDAEVPGTPGWRLAEPVRVVVRDGAGRPIAGTTVTWSSDATDAWLSTATATTDGDGIATVEFAPGKEPGTQRVIGTVGPLRAETRVAVAGMRFTSAASAFLNEQRVCGVDVEGVLWCAPYIWQQGERGGDRVPARLSDAARARRAVGDRRYLLVAGTGTAPRVNAESKGKLCALDTDGGVWCIVAGDAPVDQAVTPRAVPAPEPMVTIAVAEVGADGAATTATVCGIGRSGATYCTGSNERGEAGVGHADPVAAFTRIANDPGLVSVRAGDVAFCGVDASGRAWCWGDNRNGRFLGGANDRLPTPSAVGGTTRFSVAVPLVDGGCGIVASPSAPLHCWGSPFLTFAGAAPAPDGSAAQVVGAEGVTQLAGDGTLFGLYRRQDGAARAWGAFSDFEASLSRTPIMLPRVPMAIGPLLTTNGEIWCEGGPLTRCAGRLAALRGIPEPRP